MVTGLVALLALAACSSEQGSGSPDQSAPTPSGEPADPTGEWWRPDTATTWQWQLDGELDTGYDVDVYDVDLLDTDASTIDALHDDGRRVVCYFSAGSLESFRDETGTVVDDALGNRLDGFPDERWVDIRDASVRDRAVERIRLAADKGCDGVEPDNVDAYDNDSGFDLTAEDQADFNRFLAEEAHARGLAVGLKNDLVQIPDLVDVFDFAVNEQCHEFDECDALAPFTDGGKPVFNAEYAPGLLDDADAVCADARERSLRTLLLPVELDGAFRISCDDR